MPTANSLPDKLKDARDAVYRGTILDIAENAFADHGYKSARMKDVAKEARISLATLYGFHVNKMALYRSVQTRRLDTLMPVVTQAGAGKPLLEAMLGSMRAFLLFHTEHTAYLRMHLRQGMAWSVPDELLSPEQVEAWTVGLERMARAFRSGMDAGLFEPDDPELCARPTNSLHQVALAHWLDHSDTLSPDALCDAQSRRFVRAFCVPERVPALLAHLP